MANNYYEATGTIHVYKLTPVITSLFKMYNLDSKYPGDGKYYIAESEFQDACADWDEFLEILEDMCISRKINVDMIDHLDIDSAARYLELLAPVFGTKDSQQYQEIMAEFANMDNLRGDTNGPTLEQLCKVAQVLDDGHGLSGYMLGAAWYCSKPRLGEQGGEGIYSSKRVYVGISSTDAHVLGQAMNYGIEQKDYRQAAGPIVKHVRDIIDGVTDYDDRYRIAHQVAQEVIERYPVKPVESPNPLPKPAENDPVIPKPVYLSSQEMYEMISHDLANITDQWVDNNHSSNRQQYSLRERVEGAVRDTLRYLEHGSSSVPPMMLQPYLPDPGKSYATSSFGGVRASKDWNYHKPIELRHGEESLEKSFGDIASKNAERRYTAARARFG